ncbi:MFS transporter [Wenxinia saemankumensis]|nr:MFS transporter [Wenxinia saemankumensis]
MPPATASRPAGPSLATLVLLSATSILTLNMVLPSLGNLAQSFDLGFGAASLVVSVYMVVTALLQVVLGPLSDLYGRRPVILVSLGLFALASLGCALAGAWWLFMAFRILQAAVISANVLSRAIVRDVSPPREATDRLATIGMTLALGPMLAPMVGGFLDQAFGWRATFWLFTAAGAALLLWCWRALPETAPGGGAGAMAQIRTYPQLLRDRLFWSYTACMGLSSGVFFSFLTAAAALAAEAWGMGEALLGLCLGAPPVGFLIGNFLSKRLSARVPGARLILAGRLATLAGMSGAAAAWAVGLSGPWAFFLFMPLIGVGNGLTFPAATVGTLAVPARLVGAAAGLSGALIIGTAAVMATATGLLVGHPPAIGPAVLVLAVSALAALVVSLPAIRADWDGIERDHDAAPAPAPGPAARPLRG